MSADETILAAKTYLQRGWKIIAIHGIVADQCSCRKPLTCKSPGKHPVDHEWQIPKTWSKADVYATFDDVVNIGILTGRPSGFFVLDVDPESGGYESLDLLEMTHGKMPTSYRVRTGSGGLHIYFAMPDFDLGNSRGELKNFPGLDIRGTGGYVVAPPSVSGKGPYVVQR